MPRQVTKLSYFNTNHTNHNIYLVNSIFKIDNIIHRFEANIYGFRKPKTIEWFQFK